MAETDRTGSRSVRMTSEEIVQRGFPSKGRGIAESDVRSFLRRVADEVERLGKREDDLTDQVTELKEALASRPKATKAELLESLGAQTTRVLSSAEEAAEQMLADATAQSEAVRASAEKESEEMVIEARAQAEQTIVDAQARVRELQESSQRDAAMVIGEARSQGREIFQESVVVREQILKDLLRRRDLLMEQIDELRKGREELLESYKVVKGSFQKATDALHSVEEKASSELLTSPADVDALLKAPVELPSVLNASHPLPSFDHNEAPAERVVQEETRMDVPLDPDEAIADQASNEDSPSASKRKNLTTYMKDALGVGEDGQLNSPDDSNVTAIGAVTMVPKKKDVGALFQSLKEQSDAVEDDATLKETEEAPVAETKVSKKAKKKAAKKDPIAVRDDALSNVTTTILRKAKRQLQDEQNEVLEALRTIKGKKRVAAENILPDEQTHLKTWEESIRTDLEKVFTAGVATVSSEKFSYEEDALKSAVNWIVAPLRETLAIAIDEGDQADATSRVGARYREWRNSDLKNALYDALCSAFNTGVLVAAKKSGDVTISWSVEKAGQCPDCDDNALEPTAAGESFPTGQLAPPAHSGCRCVLTAL
ncbi:MAG TPA: DivIVA domain-containing protein [Acidimicrobiia bacterium]|nr:DivIVA domain-containing protein [Acidimicrobiia bacterium]